MADKFIFDLVAPEKLLAHKHVAMVSIPGGEGMYSVLPGHAPMITTLAPGVIDIYQNDAEGKPSEQLFVAGGFVEVTPEGCTVLADEAQPVSELHQAQLTVTMNTLRQEVAAASGAERDMLEAKLAVAAAKLQAVTGHA